MAARALMDAVGEVGFPPGTVNLVTRGVDTGRAHVAHRSVRKVSITGSTQAGQSGRLRFDLTTFFGQPTPVAPGHEGAGVVERAGAAVTQFKKGDRVLIVRVAPCQHCKPCLRG